MISSEEISNTISVGKYYLILQPGNAKQHKYYKNKFKAKKNTLKSNYNSKNNERFLNENEIKYLIKNILKKTGKLLINKSNLLSKLCKTI